jgi:hypothetical protein
MVLGSMKQRMAANPRTTDLFKEPPHRDAEPAQEVGKRQLVLRPQFVWRLVGAKDMGGPGLGVEDDHDRDPGVQILIDLGQDVAPAVVRGTDLKDQVGGHGEIPPGIGPLGTFE